MKKLRRIEKALSSIFGASENLEALNNKKDVEKNVQEMLNLIDTEGSGHSLERSELVNLVNDFLKHYEDLYGRYDHLVGKVKKSLRYSKSPNGLSFVLSSDSEGSDSDDDKSSHSYPSREEHEVSIEDYRALKDQLVSYKTENNELLTRVAFLVRKLEGCEILADKLADKETLVTRLEDNLRTIGDERSSLEAKNGSLREEIEKSLKAFADMNEKMKSLQEENESLLLEKSGLSSRVFEGDETLRGCKSEIERLEEVLLVLQTENVNLKEEMGRASQKVYNLESENLSFSSEINKLEKANKSLEEETEPLSSKNALLLSDYESLHEKFEALKGENGVLGSEILKLSIHIQELMTDIGLLRDENAKLEEIRSELKRQLDAKSDEHDSVVSDYASAVGRLSISEVELERLSAQIEKSANENSKFLIDYEELERELEAAKQEISGHEDEMISTESEKTNLLAKIQEMESVNEELRSEIEKIGGDQLKLLDKLSDVHQRLEFTRSQVLDLNKAIGLAEEENHGLKGELSTLIGKLERAETDARELESVLGKMRNEKEIIEELKADKENIVAKLSSQVQTLEVQLRLSNQKIKVTETESKEKEEGYKEMVRALQEGRRVVEERMVAASKKAVIMENDLKRMKEAARAGVAAIGDQLTRVEEGIDQRLAPALRKASGFIEELQVVRKVVAELVRHNTRMEEKFSVFLKMESEAGQAFVRAAESEKRAVESAKKAVELEKRLKDIEDEVVVMREEKREAIRQLCVLIEYHRENCEWLLKYISADAKKASQ